MLKNILIFYFLGMLNCLAFQKNYEDIDSLKKYTFSDLENKFHYNLENENLALLYALQGIKKAKNEKNFFQLSTYYNRLGKLLLLNEDLVNAHKYCDSSILVAEKNNVMDVLAKSYFLKGNLYSYTNDYQKELDYLLKSEKYFKDNDENMRYILNYNIAMLKSKVGSYEESLSMFKEIRKYELDKMYNINNKESYISTLFSLANAYSTCNKKDTVSMITKEGYKIAESLKDSSKFLFTLLEGGNQYYKGKYKASLDSLRKVIPVFKKKKNFSDLSIAYYYMGMSYDSINDYDNSIYYLEKVDSIYEKEKFLIPDFREAFEKLIDYSKSNGELQKQLYYTEHLLEVDSIISQEYKFYSSKFYNDYDTPRLLKEQKSLINILSKEKNDYKILNYFLFFGITVFTVAASFFYIRQRNYKRNFEKLISEKITQKAEIKNSILDSSETRDLDINPEIIKTVMEKLKLFESNEGFLSKRITLNTLSKDLSTNPKYLSQIINFYKQKSFNNYINDLRLTFIIEKIRYDKLYKKYSIKALAFEAGFNNSQSFSQYFYKKKGIYPSYFIKQLDKIEEV